MADERERRPEDELPEQPVQDDPLVLGGEDDLPRQPTSRRDPFVPEPGPRPGDQRAFAWLRWAWVPLLIAVGVVVVAALR